MPYLQLDVPAPLDAATKRGLAEAIGERYAAVMETGRHIPSICIRDAGGGNAVLVARSAKNSKRRSG